MVHPVTDRVGDALAVVGDRAGVEPPSPIAYEERDGVALDLCIEGDLRCARPLGALTVASRVASRRARRASERSQSPTTTTSTVTP